MELNYAVEGDGEPKTYRIKSPLVGEKLRKDTTVVGTVATCGRALYDLSVSYADDPLLREVAEDICLAYMRHISIALHEYLREHIYGDGKRSYTVHYNEIGRSYDDNPALCEVKTLEQAASLVRYINGGNMNAQERESVRVTLSVIDNAKRKAARKAQKMAAAPTD